MQLQTIRNSMSSGTKEEFETYSNIIDDGARTRPAGYGSTKETEPEVGIKMGLWF